MPPTHLAPSAPPLSGRYLSFAEREDLALRQAQGHDVRECARRMGRAPSTISRELRRNAARRCGHLEYKATTAKLAINPKRRQYVQDRLAGVIATPGGRRVHGPSVEWNGRKRGRRQHRRWGRAWSPAQIAHRLVLDFPDGPTMRISAEAI